MKKIIVETKEKAHDYFKAFGFSQEEIAALIVTGEKDLTANLDKFESLLHRQPIPTEEINQVLHALKGLIFQLGHHALAEEINESRSHLDRETLDMLSRLLLEEI